MNKVKKIVFIIASLVFIVSLSVLLFQIVQPNLAPEDSSAVIGGRPESGYPYAGFVISIYDENKVKNCGGTFVGENTVITAAHCIPEDPTVQFGIGDYTLSQDLNYVAKEVLVHPSYKFSTSSIENDVAILRFSTSPFIQKAVTVAPKRDCNYVVVGYGLTENDDLTNYRSLGKERKSADLCIESFDSKTMLIKGVDGGICFGDSGSPIFEKNTNRLVGVISAILQKDDGQKCRTNNTALAMRADYFLNDPELIQIDQPKTSSCLTTCSSDFTCLSNRCIPIAHDSLSAAANLIRGNSIVVQINDEQQVEIKQEHVLLSSVALMSLLVVTMVSISKKN